MARELKGGVRRGNGPCRSTTGEPQAGVTAGQENHSEYYVVYIIGWVEVDTCVCVVLRMGWDAASEKLIDGNGVGVG